MAYRAVTFDVYSALYDTPSGLAGALRTLFQRRRMTGDPFAAARTWRQKHMEFLLVSNSLDREAANNRRAIEAAVRYALRDLVTALTPDEIGDLVAVWERLPPWPEAVEVLHEVRRRPLAMGTLSNGETMLHALLGDLPVRFDCIVSTEGGKFKPHPSVYRKALDRLKVRPEELLHVAGSHTDAMGATAAGITTLWVNRAGEAVVDPRFAPAHESHDLRAVLALL